MYDIGNPVDDSSADIQILGGPIEIPETLRVEADALADGKLKIAHLGGYEHFELVEDSQPQVFRWTMRTKIAE